MKFLVSYVGKNRGTTDYFCDYLRNKQIDYMYLAIPMPDKRQNLASLYSFVNGKERQEHYGFISSPPVVSYIYAIILIMYIFIKNSSKFNSVFAFGAINAVAAMIPNILYRKKIFFWGVDYSPRRFENNVMNRLYLLSESIASRFATYVIQPTVMQEAIRINKHGLIQARSVMIPNGIEKFTVLSSRMGSGGSLIYLGSITEQHGIIDFIIEQFVIRKCKYALEIFGDGPKMDELKHLVHENNLKLIRIHGQKSTAEIQKFIADENKRFIGIAPYKKNNSHVSYGDSLKIKEYLSYGIPYLSSTAVQIPIEFKKFGSTYSDDSECAELISRLMYAEFSQTELSFVLAPYLWSNVFEGIPDIHA